MMLFIITILKQMMQIMKGNKHMLSKDEFLNFRQADFSKPAEEELAITELIQDAHWAHQNYIIIDNGSFSQETIDKVKNAGYKVVIGYGDDTCIKISW